MVWRCVGEGEEQVRRRAGGLEERQKGGFVVCEVLSGCCETWQRWVGDADPRVWVFREWGWCATLVRRGLDARVTSLGSVTFGVMELIPSTIHLISTTFTGQWLQTVSLKSGIAIGLLLNSAWVAVRYHSTCTRSVGTLGHCSQIFVFWLHISQANPFRKTRNLHVVWVWFFFIGLQSWIRLPEHPKR